MRVQPAETQRGAHDRLAVLVRRSWTAAERRVVLRGLYGRLLIAIEPVICGTLFGALTIGLILFPLPDSSRLSRHDAAIVLSPIFGLVALAFCAYAVVLLVSPIRALINSFSPIFIVDGYLRYRSPDRSTEADSNGYIAVLDDARRTIADARPFGDRTARVVRSPNGRASARTRSRTACDPR